MKTIRRMSVGIIVTLCCTEWLGASLVDDLASTSQETRDKAAKILREMYVSPSRTNWDGVVNALKLGTPQTLIEQQLSSSNLVSAGGLSSGNTEVKSYRLDDLWILDCSFTNRTTSISNSGLAFITLKERLRNVWVEPPTNFTGVWRTYWINGQPSHEIEYKNGQYHGVVKTFKPDGSRSVVSHKTEGVTEGEELGFHSSGRILYKGQYKAGKKVGKWIWYKEDGSIESERDYDLKK
jgi:hypothetical protein